MKQSLHSAENKPVQICVPSPVGRMLLEEQDGAIKAIRLADESEAALPDRAPKGSVLEEAATQMQEYFSGKRTEFTFAMRPKGTEFQQAVWQKLREIPYGETRTYGEIALEVGKPAAARAIGGACNKNPIWVAVPCHRVVGSGGSLTGYAYGTGMKRDLLALESENRKK